MNLPRVTDTNGLPVPLERQIASKGEGVVYSIVNQPKFVAKIYHQPPDQEHIDKLNHLLSISNPQLLKIAAWPTKLLRTNNSRQTVGFLMPFADGRPIQELYNPVQRLRAFPQASWAFQVRAAFNLAAAFDEVHKANCILADVNEGNAFVSQQALITLLDCDSIQLRTSNRVYHCNVGVPLYTPPELQGKNLRGLIRTENHDRFGLAVLIFHLLFVGRHPYAGIFKGGGDLSYDQLIAEYRFAYGPMAQSWQMQQPALTPTFADIPSDLGGLFRRAFERGSEADTRPRANDWLPVLRSLEQNLANCPSDPGHKFWKGASGCVWCRLAAKGGPEYYFGAGGTGGTFELDEVKLRQLIQRIEAVQLPDLSYNRAHFVPRGITYNGKPVPTQISQQQMRLNSLKEQLAKITQDEQREFTAFDLDQQRREKDLRSKLEQKLLEYDQKLQAERQKAEDRTTFREAEAKLVQAIERIDARFRVANEDHSGRASLVEYEAKLDAELQELEHNLRDEREQAVAAVEDEARSRRWLTRVFLSLTILGAVLVPFGTQHIAFGFAGWMLIGFFGGLFAIRSFMATTSLARQRLRQVQHQLKSAQNKADREFSDYQAKLKQSRRTTLQNLQLERQEGLRQLDQLRTKADKTLKEKLAHIAKRKADAKSQVEEALQKFRKDRDRLRKALQQKHDTARQELADAVKTTNNELQQHWRTETDKRQQHLTQLEDDLRRLEWTWSDGREQFQVKLKEATARAQRIASECSSLKPQHNAELDRVKNLAEHQARLRHLRLHLISDAEIPKIGTSRKQSLASHGIYTAEDVSEDRIAGIGGFGEALTRNLMNWRHEVLATFRFDPKASLPPSVTQELTMRYRSRQKQLFNDLEAVTTEVESATVAIRKKHEQFTSQIRESLIDHQQAEADVRLMIPAG